MMTVFVFGTLLPAAAFYLYAIVQFQKERLALRREKAAGAKTIRLPRLHAIDDGADQSGLAPADPQTGDWHETMTAAKSPAQPFYQVESAYSGPLFVVPVRDADVAPDAVAAHARLVLAMQARRI